jgi:hypothetical protein
MDDRVSALQIALKESERACLRWKTLYEQSRRASAPLENPAAVEALEIRLAPLRRLYRLGKVKPSNIFLTAQEFDALCDISSMFPAMSAALRSDDPAFTARVSWELEARFGNI